MRHDFYILTRALSCTFDHVCVCFQVCIETYESSCHQRSINTAVRATLSQILGDLTLQLRHRQEVEQKHDPLTHTHLDAQHINLCNLERENQVHINNAAVNNKILIDSLSC